MSQQRQMIVSFVKRFNQYNVGEQAGFPQAIAEGLVKRRIASMVGPAAARTPDPVEPKPAAPAKK